MNSLLSRINREKGVVIKKIRSCFTTLPWEMSSYSIPFSWSLYTLEVNSGHLVDLLRSEMRPRELKLVPDESFVSEPTKDFLEWSTLG